MRKPVTVALISIGSFLLVLGLLAAFYLGPGLLKTPLNVDSTTRLSGTATLVDEKMPVKATSLTRADSEKSSSEVVVFENSTCVVKDIDNPPNCVSNDDPLNRLITASTDKFATDRRTGMAVQDRKYVAADAGEHRGLVNKFPFQTEKKTYPMWDGTAGQVLKAKFTGTTKVRGLDVYTFKAEVSDVPVEITDGVQGLYSTKKTYQVEPLTGSIINQVEQQTRVDADGKPFIAIDLAFTPGQIKTGVDESNANLTKLNLIRKVIPPVGIVLGLGLLGAGVFLFRRKA